MSLTASQAQSRVIGLIVNGFNTVPVAWPNKAFVPETAAPDGKWARFTPTGSSITVEREVSRAAAVRKQSNAIMQFFTPLESGRTEIEGWVDEVEALLRDYVDSDMMIMEPVITPVGDDGYGKYQINLTIPYRYWICG